MCSPLVDAFSVDAFVTADCGAYRRPKFSYMAMCFPRDGVGLSPAPPLALGRWPAAAAPAVATRHRTRTRAMNIQIHALAPAPAPGGGTRRLSAVTADDVSRVRAGLRRDSALGRLSDSVVNVSR